MNRLSPSASSTPVAGITGLQASACSQSPSWSGSTHWPRYQGKLGLLPGSSMLSVSIWRLKGSVGELSRCRRMIERSMMVPEGSLTGSVIRVSIRGSVETEQNTLTPKNKSRRFLPGRQSRGELWSKQPLKPLSKGRQQMMKADEGLALPSVTAAGRRKEQRRTARQQVQGRTLCLGIQTPS